MNGWIAAAIWGALFAFAGALCLYAIAYVGDNAVNPWPGYGR